MSPSEKHIMMTSTKIEEAKGKCVARGVTRLLKIDCNGFNTDLDEQNTVR
jgi:hypothetical protein